MHYDHLEPGMLRVFRLYAWLLLASKAILPLHLMRDRVFFFSAQGDPPPPQPFTIQLPPPNLTEPLLFIGLYMTLLFALLYWQGLQKRLSGYFLPAALVVSTVGLMVEQSLLMRQGIFWQVYPFLIILLILVAWQYSFRHVVAFTVLTVALQIALIVFYPSPIGFPDQGASQQPIPVFGFLFTLPPTFLVLGYIVSQLVEAQRKQRQELAEANQKLVSHAGTLEQLAVSRERIRISRELHDTLAHTLSALSVQFEALQTLSSQMPSKARDMLEKMHSETRSGLNETRRALAALRASPLEDLGLVAALRTLSEDFSRRHNLTLAFEAADDLEDLPLEVEQSYYRVAQEALENASRHAQASRLEVLLEEKNGLLELIIRDDGEGFPAREGKNGSKFGLKGMEERAELIHAKLEIDSQIGQGTTVRMAWEMV